jgi:hypothetical protein
LAFLETMVAFSPYHVANDEMPTTRRPSRAKRKCSQTAFIIVMVLVLKLVSVPYDKLHAYMAEGPWLRIGSREGAA